MSVSCGEMKDTVDLQPLLKGNMTKLFRIWMIPVLVVTLDRQFEVEVGIKIDLVKGYRHTCSKRTRRPKAIWVLSAVDEMDGSVENPVVGFQILLWGRTTTSLTVLPVGGPLMEIPPEILVLGGGPVIFNEPNGRPSWLPAKMVESHEERWDKLGWDSLPQVE